MTWNWLNLKHTGHKHAFQYHSVIWWQVFKKISITIWDKAVETKWKIYFSAKKSLSPNINVVLKVLRFWQQRLTRFKLISGSKGENLEFKKLSCFLNLPDFFVFWSPVHKVRFILHKKQLMLAFESDRFHALNRLGE